MYNNEPHTGEKDAHEKDDLIGAFLAKPEYPFLSATGYMRKTREQPGRYILKQSLFDELSCRIAEKALSQFGFSEQHLKLVDSTNFVYSIPHKWQVLANLLHKRGLIVKPIVYFDRLYHDEPKFYQLRLFASPPKDTDGHKNFASGYSRGVSDNFEEALSKVFGEFFERLPLTVYKKKDFTRASIQNFEKRKSFFLDPHLLAGFSDTQKREFPDRSFTKNSVFSWVKGEELTTGKKAYIPAQLVYWNYCLHEGIEPTLREANSNGAAGHFTFEEAVLSGIYENIQRDAFLIHWLRSIPPPRIDLNTIKNARLQRIISDAARYQFEIIFLNTQLDMPVPSCVCVLINKTDIGPKIALGGGCGKDLAEAMVRSATEAFGVLSWVRSQSKEIELGEQYVPFNDSSIRQEERLILWNDKKIFHLFEDFLKGDTQSFELANTSLLGKGVMSPKEELSRIKEFFNNKGKGYEIFVYEAHHDILDTVGYKSVRTIIPQLLPLYLNETKAPLGSKRLRELPESLGKKCTQGYINPYPHPFP